MKLTDIKEMMNENWVVHWEEREDDIVTYTTINIKKLYDDWRGSYHHCPPSCTNILNVQFGDDCGNVYLIECDDNNLGFETLMYTIEESFRRSGKNTPKSQTDKLRANKNPEIRNIVECAYDFIKHFAYVGYARNLFEEIGADIVEDVIASSNLQCTGEWSDIDVQMAIGRVLSDRLGVPQ